MPTDQRFFLRDIQQAFSNSIRVGLDITEDGHALREERYDPHIIAALVDSPGRPAVGRLGVYNQQYWFRLLTVMQEEHPLLRRLLGLIEFNKLSSAYLDRFPSRNPSLNLLSDFLVEFLDSDSRWGTVLLRQAGLLDYLHIRAFDAAQLPVLYMESISSQTMDRLLHEPLHFQPAWWLFREDWNLVSARRQALATSGTDDIITPSPGISYWAIFRGPIGIGQESLSVSQYRLLALLAKGASLTSACDMLTNELDSHTLVEVNQSIGSWFHRWAQLGWFAASSRSSVV